MPWPKLSPLEVMQERLEAIFPAGIQNRAYLVRDMATRVIFVMLYIDAIEGRDRWLGPKHVYGMSDEQASDQSTEARLAYAEKGWRPGYRPKGKPWYADTTREPIRDETLRDGLLRVGAAICRSDVATTSGLPRYALCSDFAALFDPSLGGKKLTTAVQTWQQEHLDALALARIALLRRGAAAALGNIPVTLPDGSLRQLAPGPSSIISKAVVEQFAKTFLYQPVVVLLSESGNKIIAQDEATTSAINLHIETDRLLPDIILFDLEKGRELLVFVEVVATAGPVSEERRKALQQMATGARISSNRIAYLTAYLDRNAPAFRRTFHTVAWNTLIWFAAEPEYVVVLRERPSLSKGRIFELLQ